MHYPVVMLNQKPQPKSQVKEKDPGLEALGKVRGGTGRT
jgi:hypothetical protein